MISSLFSDISVSSGGYRICEAAVMFLILHVSFRISCPAISLMEFDDTFGFPQIASFSRIKFVLKAPESNRAEESEMFVPTVEYEMKHALTLLYIIEK